MRRSSVLLVAVGLLAVMAAFLLRAPDPARRPSINRESVALDSAGASLEPGVVLREAPAARIRVVSESGAALLGAVVAEGHSKEGMLAVGRSVESESDRDGIIVLPESVVGRDLLVSSAGYLTREVEQVSRGLTEVVLGAAAQLEVRCVRDGSGLAGCRVFVSRGELISGDHAMACEHVVGHGDVGHAKPVWVGTSDANGDCHFDVPPEGKYRVAVYHDAAYPDADVALGLQEVDPASGQVLVVMRDMYAVVAGLPDGSACRAHFWSLDHRSFLRTKGVWRECATASSDCYSDSPTAW